MLGWSFNFGGAKEKLKWTMGAVTLLVTHFGEAEARKVICFETQDPHVKIGNDNRVIFHDGVTGSRRYNTSAIIDAISKCPTVFDMAPESCRYLIEMKTRIFRTGFFNLYGYIEWATNREDVVGEPIVKSACVGETLSDGVSYEWTAKDIAILTSIIVGSVGALGLTAWAVIKCRAARELEEEALEEDSKKAHLIDSPGSSHI
jgi:hypothetical protein